MRLCENPGNVFNQALVCRVIPRDSSGLQTKYAFQPFSPRRNGKDCISDSKESNYRFAITSAELKSFNAVSEFLRNAGYDEVMDRHELENQAARADGALGYALVLLHCEAPQLSRLLQVKPVLISYEAIEAYGRSPVPNHPREDLAQVLGRAIDEDWARLYHMSVIAAAHFMEPNSIVRARA
ncbi:hypothetical protein FRC12_020765 [Ceratobasidium sp. 428]|nr:hypothetical protein FRC12_020765 [Ceratobasidium sp. 428]